MEALKKKEIQGETQFTTKNDGFLNTPPTSNANVFSYFWVGFYFFESHPICHQT